MKLAKLFSLALAAGLALSLSSCGTSFRSEWNVARAQSPVPNGIEGAWEGSWLSTVSGHTGKLWCVIKDGPANERIFDYRATWGHILSGSFSAKHQLKRQGAATTFVVEHPIGKRGAFHAEGTITADKFSASYEAVGDRGTFSLTRPQRL